MIEASSPGARSGVGAEAAPDVPRAEAAQIRIFVRCEADVAAARSCAHALAIAQGLTEPEAVAVATAVSEIAWNVVVHAGRGEMAFAPEARGGRRGVVAVARDRWPGISDVARAMEDGFSTRRGLGFGLAAARRLMDEFELTSAVGAGTTVTMRKWARAG